MNKTLGLTLIGYSLLLAAFSYFTHHTAPSLARATLVTGSVGALLCFIWGLRSALGKGGKTLPILTLVPVTFVMLSQTVLTWGGGSSVVPGQRTAAVVITVLFAVSFGMLMRIAYAGVIFDAAGDSGRTERDPARQAGPGTVPSPRSPVEKRQ